ncbi:MAG: tetratricopeptide repeat protein [Gemmatimonadaceae bacterium]
MTARVLALALTALASEAGAQYPFVPPPTPCVPITGLRLTGKLIPIARSSAPPRTLGIAPFGYAGSPADLDPLIGGLGDRLVARLRAVRPLAVARWRGTDESILLDSAAVSRLLEQIGARRLLMGQVRGDGPDVAVSVQLYDGATGGVIWQESLRRPLTDVLDLELALARHVAAHSFGTLTDAERAAVESTPTRDPLAFGLYVRGGAKLAGGGDAGSGIADLGAAVQRDSTSAPIWSELSAAYTRRATLLSATPARDSLLRLATAAANRGVALAPRSAVGWLARGAALGARDPRRLTPALSAFEQAVAVERRNAEAHRQLAHGLMLLGRSEAAALHLNRALEIEPEQAAPLLELATMELHERAYRESCRTLDLALSVDPRFASAYVLRAMIRLRLGDLRYAWVDAETGRRLGAEIAGSAVSALADLTARDTAGARSRLALLLRLVESGPIASVSDGSYVALVAVAIGNNRRALDVLEHLRPRGADLRFALLAPGFDGLRSAPRFRRLVEASSSSGGER